ncbi:MAG TPA: polysaccharide deacetylase family protein [candidate division Zixibacteria bacterium]|nr:polysaccharide deacetylase family protein [candidate division Zixibacteria bacterium]
MKSERSDRLKGQSRLMVFGSALLMILLAGAIMLQLTASAEAQGKGSTKKEICVTFDELPASKAFGDVDRQAITYLILQALKRHNVKAAGFVIGDQIEGAYDILGEWLNDGHVLGNMTFSYQDLNELGDEQFIDDIGAGHDALEQMLSGFGQKNRYFRFPFLHYGTTVEARRQVNGYLKEHKYKIAHTTVVVEDYLYNLSLDKLGKTPDSTDYDNLLADYVNHVTEAIQLAEVTSTEVLHRPCRQILALKANRINAVSLDIVLSAIENLGYKFITLDEALKDPVYSQPQAYFGSKGVGFLDMIQQSDPDLLPAQ